MGIEDGECGNWRSRILSIATSGTAAAMEPADTMAASGCTDADGTTAGGAEGGARAGGAAAV